MLIYDIIDTITLEDVERINEIAKTEPVKIIIPNTKGISADIIEKINETVIISVTGGLNPKKKKFNHEYYQSRTYYSSIELAQIIRAFEEIERCIVPTWNETEKCAFVYRVLCDYIDYKNDEDRKNITRPKAFYNLMGMITKRNVCSGFAIVFKEAMDRIGIECHYQNKSSSHSWNIVKLDGIYRGVDLTWDSNLKPKYNNSCGFRYFARMKDFYEEPNHNISNEEEEIKYPVERISIEELAKIIERINKERVRKCKMSELTNIDGEKVQFSFGSKNGTSTFYIISFSDNIPQCIEVHEDGKLEEYFTKKYINKNNAPYKIYTRDDGTSFGIMSTGKSIGEMREYVLMVVRDKTEGYEFGISPILSETDLLTKSKPLEHSIANILLERKRFIERIKYFNGYVGYITLNKEIECDEEFERDTLHIAR